LRACNARGIQPVRRACKLAPAIAAGATEVAFGSADANEVTVDSNDQITAVAPAGEGTVDITVTTPDGTSPLGDADQFNV
jgi:hypothetical protein